MTRRLGRSMVLGSLVLTLGIAAARAAEPVNQTFFGGLAIHGYDPVAYFDGGQAREGRKEYEHEWRGAVWRFASAAHRDRFAADPGRYAPQYGGYCAYAVAKGTTADIDPEAWRIVDGKLYLNKSLEIQRRWEQDIPGFIAQADENWPGLRDR